MQVIAVCFFVGDLFLQLFVLGTEFSNSGKLQPFLLFDLDRLLTLFLGNVCVDFPSEESQLDGTRDDNSDENSQKKPRQGPAYFFRSQAQALVPGQTGTDSLSPQARDDVAVE